MISADEQHEGLFPPTQLSKVLKAAGRLPREKALTSEAEEALADIYLRYRRPLLVVLNRYGLPKERAEDLLHDFFLHLIDKNSMAKFDRSRGRFRTFLLSSLRHLHADLFDRANAGKRGGGVKHLRIVAQDHAEEGEEGVDPPGNQSQDGDFDRAWAGMVLENALDRLEKDYAARRRGAVFKALKSRLTDLNPGNAQADTARALGMTVGSVKTELSRMRERFRYFIDLEIGSTLGKSTMDAVGREREALQQALSVGWPHFLFK